MSAGASKTSGIGFPKPSQTNTTNGLKIPTIIVAALLAIAAVGLAIAAWPAAFGVVGAWAAAHIAFVSSIAVGLPLIGKIGCVAALAITAVIWGLHGFGICGSRKTLEPAAPQQQPGQPIKNDGQNLPKEDLPKEEDLHSCISEVIPETQETGLNAAYHFGLT